MQIKKISDVESGIAALVGFRSGRTSAVERQRRRNAQFSAAKRDDLYSIIEQAYALASELLSEANAAVLEKLLEQHGLKVDKRKGCNPWVGPINLLFGRWVPAKGVKPRYFQPDRSAWKYAGSFRFFHEHQWPAAEIAERLKNHKPRALGGRYPWGQGLIATQREDAYDHRKQDANVREDNELLKSFVGHALPLAEISKGSALINDGVERQFVALWGIVIEQRVHIFGELPQRSSGVRSHALKAARELERYLKGPHKKDPRSPKFLPSAVVNRQGHLIRKEGMDIVDIEEVFAADTAARVKERHAKSVRPRPVKSKTTMEVPFPLSKKAHKRAEGEPAL